MNGQTYVATYLRQHGWSVLYPNGNPAVTRISDGIEAMRVADTMNARAREIEAETERMIEKPRYAARLVPDPPNADIWAVIDTDDGKTVHYFATHLAAAARADFLNSLHDEPEPEPEPEPETKTEPMNKERYHVVKSTTTDVYYVIDMGDEAYFPWVTLQTDNEDKALLVAETLNLANEEDETDE